MKLRDQGGHSEISKNVWIRLCASIFWETKTAHKIISRNSALIIPIKIYVRCNISLYLKMLLVYMIKKTIAFLFSQWLQFWILLLLIFGGFNSTRFLYWNILIVLSPYKKVVATFSLHSLGHRIKYGNPEAENITQQSCPRMRPYCSIEFIESFWFWASLVTYNIGAFM